MVDLLYTLSEHTASTPSGHTKLRLLVMYPSVRVSRQPHNRSGARIRVSSGRSRRRTLLWLDREANARAKGENEDAAERCVAARRPRYERDMRDVDMDEEAELRH